MKLLRYINSIIASKKDIGLLGLFYRPMVLFLVGNLMMGSSIELASGAPLLQVSRLFFDASAMCCWSSWRKTLLDSESRRYFFQTTMACSVRAGSSGMNLR